MFTLNRSSLEQVPLLSVWSYGCLEINRAEGATVQRADSDTRQVGLASLDDVEGCVSLAVDLLAHDPAERRTKVRADIAAERDGRDGTAPHNKALFVARIDGRVAGYSRVELWTPPADGPGTDAPGGWYLMGLLVDPRHRRSGVGLALTEARLEWLRTRTGRVWYFSNARNAASLALHAQFGFREVTRQFSFPTVSFEGGVGVLCVADLA